MTGQSGSVASFRGPIVFTGLGGTLTAVTGRVRLVGVTDLGAGVFTERVTGRLCVGR